MTKKTILFVGGGSGGHITPLVAVMQSLYEQAGDTINYSYAGLAADLNSPILDGLPFAYKKYAVRSGKLHRAFTWEHLIQAKEMVMGLRQGRRLLKEISPDLIFMKGGFVTIPLAIAAARAKIPLYCHETDLVPGLANRLVAQFATKVFTAYPAEKYQFLPSEKLIASGQPVRAEFFLDNHQSPLELAGKIIPIDQPLITVIGGSQGARRVNQLIASMWPELVTKAWLVHITGPHEFAQFHHLASEVKSDKLIVLPFVGPELATLFARSTLVISRAGGSVAELAAVGAPTLLVPLSTAAQNHQCANARFFVEAKAAEVVDEKTITTEKLLEIVEKLLNSPSQRHALSMAIKKLARPQAAQEMAHILYRDLIK